MSQRTLDDTDYWNMDEGMDLEFVQSKSKEQIYVIANGNLEKPIAHIMKISSSEQDKYIGMAIHFDHLIKSEHGVFGAMFSPCPEFVGDYVDFYFYGSHELKYMEHLS